MEMPESLKRVDGAYAEMAKQCPEPVEGLYWIYILLMRNQMFYVGHTCDIASRIQRHAEGSGSRQARQLKEFVLVFVEGPMGADAAIKRERQLKKWSRAKKMALINGNAETLKSLSKSREA